MSKITTSIDKCKTCKNRTYCSSFCYGSLYESSLFKLIKEKIKNMIIEKLKLWGVQNEFDRQNKKRCWSK